ncbi:hypothetical protein Q1695_005395 [Nippostrongylus brasiliensis]|nr:hypothetical protein Q1695_005395 [Nippostrongylus brasiliensis]
MEQDDWAAVRRLNTANEQYGVEFEEELIFLYAEMKGQYEQLRVVEDQLKHVKDSTILGGGSLGERGAFLAQLMLSVSTSRQKLLRLETSYMMVDERYEFSAKYSARASWDQRISWLRTTENRYGNNAIRSAVNITLQRMNTVTAAIGKEWRIAECALKQTNSDSPALQRLHDAVMNQTRLLEELSQKFDARAEGMGRDAPPRSPYPVAECKNPETYGTKATQIQKINPPLDPYMRFPTWRTFSVIR